MAYDFSELKSDIEDTKEWLRKEYQGIRSGEATPAILDNVKVESYGTTLPLNQAGSVTREDARTLRVSPWDASQVPTIEKAIRDADLGLSLVSDERGVRVIFPELTGERRGQLKKLTNDKLEQARIALRNERDKAQKDIDAKEKASELSEDEKFRARQEMQKLIDAANEELEAMAKRKEQELEQ